MDLLFWAHKLHAVLGPRVGCSPQLQTSSAPSRNVHCFKCSFPLVHAQHFWLLHFGFCSAPAIFQRLRNTVLADLIYKSCAVYWDDIVAASPTFEQHLVDLKEVLTRLESAGLSVKLEKCQFCRSELQCHHGQCPDKWGQSEGSSWFQNP